MTDTPCTHLEPSGSFRTADFALWVGAIALLLTVYTAAEWGLARYLRGIDSNAELSGAALPRQIRIWTAKDPATVGWMFKRFYDIQERAEFDREVLRDLLGVGESYDFWALWAFNFDEAKPFELDRARYRVVIRSNSAETKEVPIARSVESADGERAYLPVSLGWAIPMGEAGVVSTLPPGTAKKWLVAFERTLDADAIEGVEIERQDGTPIQLATREIPSREVEEFLSRPKDEDFPGAR